ncbi:hypothetical protein U1Q18_026534 [Sarracenia purpurea var. burkii]
MVILTIDGASGGVFTETRPAMATRQEMQNQSHKIPPWMAVKIMWVVGIGSDLEREVDIRRTWAGYHSMLRRWRGRSEIGRVAVRQRLSGAPAAAALPPPATDLMSPAVGILGGIVGIL